MKNVFFTAMIVLFSFITVAQTGKVKVYFSGFICERETWDDALQLDGKGDEVFVTFQVVHADAQGNTKLIYNYKTPVYGDATGGFSNRINVGSCVDAFGAQKGGIKAGDRYATNDLIGEFEMSSTDVLTITPVIWEWDPAANISNTLLTRLKDDATHISRETAKLLGSNNGTFSPAVQTIGDISKFIFPFTLFLSPDLYGFVQNVIGKQETRPIGITASGNFTPQFMVLNTELINNLIKINIGHGPGVVPLHYNEVALGNEREHGNYILYMRTEFIPSPTTVTVVAPVSSQTIQNTYMVAPAGTSTTTTTTTTSQPASEPTNTSGSSKSGTPKGKSSGRPVR
jgi:hypothetical protein